MSVFPPRNPARISPGWPPRTRRGPSRLCGRARTPAPMPGGSWPSARACGLPRGARPSYRRSSRPRRRRGAGPG